MTLNITNEERALIELSAYASRMARAGADIGTIILSLRCGLLPREREAIATAVARVRAEAVQP